MAAKKRRYDYDDEYEDERFDDEDDDFEIDLVELLMIIRRHMRVIIAITVIITGIGIGFAMSRPAVYKAETTLIVSSGNIYSAKNLDEAEMRRNQQMVVTYTEIAKSPSVMNAIIRKLDLDTTAKGLAGRVKIEPVEDTEIMKISTTDGNAVRAMQIVNETANEFIIKAKDVMTFENIKVIEPANVPKVPESRKRALIIAISFVLGAMLGVFTMIVIELFQSKIRNPKDIKKILGVDVLTHVPVYEQIDELEVMHENNGFHSIMKLGNIGRKKKKSGGKK